MRILIPLIIVVVVLGINYVANQRMVARFDYQCASCGNRFSLSAKTASFAPHRMSAKYVRCPSCGHRGWATRMPKSTT